jgi:crotonobetainyl-CoA:carnitine CoA-transferase CaiB-like acyl-CoA transferase
MSVLSGLRVARIGQGLAAAVAGRVLADLGAMVGADTRDDDTALGVWLNDGVGEAPGIESADLIIAQAPTDRTALRARNPTAAIVLISPFGATGPDRDRPWSDLTLLAASGMSRLLTGQVDDIAEPPIRPVGGQSAFIAGLAAACAGVHAIQATPGAFVDVSMQEALATLAMTELTRAGQTGRGWRRKREADGNGATVCILPARDGYAAISPREDRQWAAWLLAMGDPPWGREPRFRTKPDRAANWDALHALMSDWSRGLSKAEIATIAQDAHVPSFPLLEVAEHLEAEQLAHRRYFRTLTVAGKPVKAPGNPFGLSTFPGPARKRSAAALPLAGLRVLDFSWVIAGPTTTRYLAAMGADVIKVEAPGRGDPGRASELHLVLGQAKRAIVLDLKNPEAVALARDLAARCDVLIENFATGVMDRLGLGADDLRVVNPDLVYVSASGLGRTGPEAGAVAYGTLLQSYAGFAGLNRFPDRPPRIGFAWADPMCALMLALVTAAALWRRGRAGGGARVDFSMIEAMLWTMAEPVLRAQTEGALAPIGLTSREHAPHGVYPCAGEDQWVAVAVDSDAVWDGLRRLVPDARDRRDCDAAIAAWSRDQTAQDAAARLRAEGVAAEAVAGSLDLLRSAHLAERGFWDRSGSAALPGLPWHANFGRANGPAPGLGEHTDSVLAEVLGLSAERIASLRAAGALG